MIDIDDTISRTESGNYASATVIAPMRRRLQEYRQNGFTIVLFTARNMRTYNGNTGLIIANTVPVLIDWLQRHEIEYDEIHVGKPWCGFDGFYVDDKAIRPDEFTSLSLSEIEELLARSADRMRELEAGEETQ